MTGSRRVLIAGSLAFARLARTYTFALQDRARSAAIHIAAGLVFSLVHNMALTAIYLLLLRPGAPTFDRFISHFRTSLAYLFYQDVLAAILQIQRARGVLIGCSPPKGGPG